MSEHKKAQGRWTFKAPTGYQLSVTAWTLSEARAVVKRIFGITGKDRLPIFVKSTCVRKPG